MEKDILQSFSSETGREADDKPAVRHSIRRDEFREEPKRQMEK